MAVSKIFEKQGQKVIWGDAIEMLTRHVADGSVDLIFADPPYNIGKSFNGIKERWISEDAHLQWCYQWLDLCIQKLKPTGSFYVMTSTQNMPYFDLYLRSRLKILSRIIWYYDSSGVQARRHFGSLYEPILFCVKDDQSYTFNAEEILVEAKTGAHRKLIDHRKPIPKIYNAQKVPGNVWEFPRVRYRMNEYENHPTQKPVAMLERVIKASTNPGDLVLDPFAGTFTTADVARKLGRRTISIEIEEAYLKIGLRRLEIANHYKGEPLLKAPRNYKSLPPGTSLLQSQ